MSTDKKKLQIIYICKKNKKAHKNKTKYLENSGTDSSSCFNIIQWDLPTSDTRPDLYGSLHMDNIKKKS